MSNLPSFLGFLAVLVVASSASAGTVTGDAVARSALEHSPSLAASREDLKRARLLEEGEQHRYGYVLTLDGSANSNATPQLSGTEVVTPTSQSFKLGGQVSRRLPWGTDVYARIDASAQGSQTPAGNDVLELGPGYAAGLRVGVTQPILRGAGREIIESPLLLARAGLQSASSETARVTSQLFVDVLGTYWELYNAGVSVDIQRKTLAVAIARRDETAARVRTGSLAPAELLSFETRIASLEEDVAAALAEEQRWATELARLAGDASFETARADLSHEPTVPGLPPADLRDRALAASYELATQRAGVRQAEIQVATSADPLRPRLDLDAWLQPQGLGNQAVLPALEQVGTLGALSAHVGLTYELPLDDTRTRTERERAETAVQAATLRLEATEQRVVSDVERALTNDESARRRLALAATTRDVATRQLAAENDRYRTGSSTSIQVREAEDQVRSADLRRTRALVDLVKAALTIEHLEGTLAARFGAGALP